MILMALVKVVKVLEMCLLTHSQTGRARVKHPSASAAWGRRLEPPRSARFACTMPILCDFAELADRASSFEIAVASTPLATTWDPCCVRGRYSVAHKSKCAIDYDLRSAGALAASLILCGPEGGARRGAPRRRLARWRRGLESSAKHYELARSLLCPVRIGAGASTAEWGAHSGRKKPQVPIRHNESTGRIEWPRVFSVPTESWPAETGRTAR